MGWSGTDLSRNPRERVQDFMDAMCANPAYKGHDRDLFKKYCTLKSVTMPPDAPYPTVVVRLTTDESMANPTAHLHGGAIATIFDDITTLPLTLVAREGAWQLGGVSRALNVSYLKGAPVGEDFDVVAELVNAGGRLALIRGTMIKVSDGVTVATAMHDKANTDPPAPRI